MAEDVGSVTLGLQSMTVANLEEMTGTDTMMRPNFPLPRELRDQIYSYLLCAEHVYEDRWYKLPPGRRGDASTKNHRSTSIAGTYHFHVNVLATNHEIYEKASKVLQTNNFVIVSHLWPDIAASKHSLGVPIVTENHIHVGSFQRHVLRVHVQAAQDTLSHKNVKTQSFLMVGRDLRSLCTFLRWMLHATRTPAKFISQGGAAHEARISESELSSKSAPAIRIKFQDKSLTELKPQLASSFLKPFMMVIIGLQDVKVLNAGDNLALYVQDMVKTMAPRSIWTNAMAWHVLETLNVAKQTADRLVREGNYLHASVMYQNVWTIHAKCPLFYLEASAYDSETCGTLSILYILMMNSIISDGFITITRNDADIRSCCIHIETVKRIGHAITALPDPSVKDQVQNSVIMMSAIMGASWLTAMSRFVFDRTNDTLKTVYDEMIAVKFILSGSELVQHDWKLVHDIAMDKKARAKYLSTPSSRCHDLVTRIAAGKMAPPIMDTLPASFSKPDRLFDLVDEAHFERIQASDTDFAATLL